MTSSEIIICFVSLSVGVLLTKVYFNIKFLFFKDCFRYAPGTGKVFTTATYTKYLPYGTSLIPPEFTDKVKFKFARVISCVQKDKYTYECLVEYWE